MSNNSIKRQRGAWFKQHPYCCYCGCKLIMPAYAQRMKNVPPNAATIEHLRPRGHPGRHEPNRFNLWRRALACRSCNAKRDQEFTRRRSLEELWRGAGQWPRMPYQCGALPGEVSV